MDKEIVKEVYATSGILDDKISIHRQYSTKPTDIHGTVAERIASDAALLDVGCGIGDFLVYLQEHRHCGPLTGIDISAGVFAQAAAEWNSITFLQADAEQLPFIPKSFDVVTTFHMLSHLTDVSIAYAEFARVLRSRGLFVASANSLRSYPHVNTYRRRIHERYGWGEPTFTTSRFNLENMIALLESYWDVELVTIKGELRIPLKPFMHYFNANIDVWSARPIPITRAMILESVAMWAHEDALGGYILEPKYVGVAFCRPRKST